MMRTAKIITTAGTGEYPFLTLFNILLKYLVERKLTDNPNKPSYKIKWIYVSRFLSVRFNAIFQ